MRILMNVKAPVVLDFRCNDRMRAELGFSDEVTVERHGLACGDYTIPRLERVFAVKVIGLEDFRGAMIHGKKMFDMDMAFMQGLSFARVVVVGMGIECTGEHCAACPDYGHCVEPMALAFECEIRHGVPFAYVETEKGAATLVEFWARAFLLTRGLPNKGNGGANG